MSVRARAGPSAAPLPVNSSLAKLMLASTLAANGWTTARSQTSPRTSLSRRSSRTSSRSASAPGRRKASRTVIRISGSARSRSRTKAAPRKPAPPATRRWRIRSLAMIKKRRPLRDLVPRQPFSSPAGGKGQGGGNPSVTLSKTVSAIAVIGTGYVGLTTAVCLAKLGHQVVGVDIDEAKVARLRSGEPTIYEPGLEELMRETQKSGRLVFTSDYREGIPAADFVFIAVGTPPGRRGEADLVYVKQAAKGIAGAMQKSVTIVNKSTVPIGTGNIVARIVGENLQGEIPFHVVSNPEFLREGSAIQDFMHPDRLVFGSHHPQAAQAVAGLYSKLETRILITDLHSAEMIKYASNAFLATRISFINEIARICERVDADVKVVAEGMGLDRRIGPSFLEAGLGYGGSCFPNALARMAESMGYHPQLLDTVTEINLDQRRYIVEKLHEVLGQLRDQTIGLLGLSYKPNTD